MEQRFIALGFLVMAASAAEHVPQGLKPIEDGGSMQAYSNLMDSVRRIKFR